MTRSARKSRYAGTRSQRLRKPRIPAEDLGRAPRDFYLIGDAIQQRSSGAVDPDFRFRNTVAQYFDKGLELPALSMFDGLQHAGD
jgi:hypothetical protein